ncbi:MAG: Arc family DNA-binding protein [Phycisphaerae bacterium]
MADRKSFLLRLPPDLMEDLNRWARDELRSLNAQIEYLLRESVRRRRGGEPASDAPDARVSPPGAGAGGM